MIEPGISGQDNRTTERQYDFAIEGSSEQTLHRRIVLYPPSFPLSTQKKRNNGNEFHQTKPFILGVSQCALLAAAMRYTTRSVAIEHVEWPKNLFPGSVDILFAYRTCSMVRENIFSDPYIMLYEP